MINPTWICDNCNQPSLPDGRQSCKCSVEDQESAWQDKQKRPLRGKSISVPFSSILNNGGRTVVIQLDLD